MDYDPTIQKTQVKSIAKEPASMSTTSHRTQLETTENNITPPNDTSSDSDSTCFNRRDQEDDGSIEGRISHLTQSIYVHFIPIPLLYCLHSTHYTHYQVIIYNSFYTNHLTNTMVTTRHNRFSRRKR